MHLAELPKPDVLNRMLPGLGRDWTEIISSLTGVYYHTVSYSAWLRCFQIVYWSGS